MYRTVYTVRHGHYRIPHPRKNPDGSEPSVLSIMGIESIVTLSHKLRHIDKDIKKIYASPLKRTMETAEILAKILRVDVTVRDNIRENYFKDGNLDHLKDVYMKFRECTDEVLDFKDGNSIIVSHKFPMSLFVARASGFSFKEISEDRRHINLVRMGDCLKLEFNNRDLVKYERI